MALSWIQKTHLLLSSQCFCVDLLKCHKPHADSRLRWPLALATHARRCPSCARVRVERTLTSDVRAPAALSDRVHVLISEQSAGTAVKRPHRRRWIQNQQRCLTPCPPCASWDLLPSPPPATSRTAPEEGSERCRRLRSDRWGPVYFLSSLAWFVSLP